MRMFNSLTRFAQFASGASGGRLSIASMLLVGRFLGAVLMCPGGWQICRSAWQGGPFHAGCAGPGWPLGEVSGATLWAAHQRVQVSSPVLVILGGSTVAAVAVGIVYGRAKRVWCRYQCR